MTSSGRPVIYWRRGRVVCSTEMSTSDSKGYVHIKWIGVNRFVRQQRRWRGQQQWRWRGWNCSLTTKPHTLHYWYMVRRVHQHDDVIKWKHFHCYWPFVRETIRLHATGHKGQWRGALVFSLICAWTNNWANNRDVGDLRRYRAHYDVTVMK